MTGDTKARIIMVLVIVVAITIAVCMIAGCADAQLCRECQREMERIEGSR